MVPRRERRQLLNHSCLILASAFFHLVVVGVNPSSLITLKAAMTTTRLPSFSLASLRDLNLFADRPELVFTIPTVSIADLLGTTDPFAPSTAAAQPATAVSHSSPVGPAAPAPSVISRPQQQARARLDGYIAPPHYLQHFTSQPRSLDDLLHCPPAIPFGAGGNLAAASSTSITIFNPLAAFWGSSTAPTMPTAAATHSNVGEPESPTYLVSDLAFAMQEFARLRLHSGRVGAPPGVAVAAESWDAEEIKRMREANRSTQGRAMGPAPELVWEMQDEMEDAGAFDPAATSSEINVPAFPDASLSLMPSVPLTVLPYDAEDYPEPPLSAFAQEAEPATETYQSPPFEEFAQAAEDGGEGQLGGIAEVALGMRMRGIHVPVVTRADHVAQAAEAGR
ncbi:hypothetical protein HK101_008269 [Irineochytrium annulatum]|nr:hypothetical protein HK101_008269 [Irineochytrium annulatum]